MSGPTMRVSQDVLRVLGGATVNGNLVSIRTKLDRQTYMAVNKVLEAIGGQWSRSAQAYAFTDDAEERVQAVLLAGEITLPSEMGFFPTPEPLARELLENDADAFKPSGTTVRTVTAVVDNN